MNRLATDLLVAGGGVAGCCAAIAAARRGVRTLLVEQQGYLGGIGVAGMLQYICGLYGNGNSLPAATLNHGLPREIVTLLNQASPEKAIQKIGQVYVLPYVARQLQDVFCSLIQAETTLTLLTAAAVSGVETTDGTVRAVTLEAEGRTQRVEVAMAVDCTGDGNLAALAGAEVQLAPLHERQLAGFTLCLNGIEADDGLAIKVPYCCARAVEQGRLPFAMKFTLLYPGSSPGEAFLKMSVDEAEAPDRDERVRLSAHALLACLQEMVPAFRNAVITDSSARVVEREGRRIVGDYLLTEEDVLSARKFPDAVLKNCWPVELWDRARGTSYKYLPCDDYYEIPFRCLAVKGFSNLLTAGRCISVSPAALGSTRVMGTCMALGEQAGLAAAAHVITGRYPELTTREP